jgi:hypothetical protein
MYQAKKLTAAGPPAAQQLFICIQLGHVAQATAKTIEQFLMKFVSRCSERVVRPQALLAHDDQTSLSQIGQVSRDFGLGNIQYRLEIADARLAPLQHVKNAKPGPI